MTKPIISFKNYSFQYKAQSEPTITNINLEINKGEKILIIGPSGSGKSTIGNCINGLIPYVYSGTIEGDLTINGINTKESSVFEISKNVGTVLQDSDGQFVGLSVAEDIAFALENDNVPLQQMKNRVNSVAKLVNMTELLKSNPFELSGGQKQRVALAGVLVDDVDILLFDEPLASLDPMTGEIAIDLIDQIHKSGKTIIIIEHRLEDVLYRDIDKIVVVNDGKIIANGTPDEVLCSDLLEAVGVREPLYVTACKYAGIKLTPEMRPGHLDTLDFNKVTNKLKKWYDSNQKDKPTEEETTLLKVDNINFSYDGVKKVLNDINLDIYNGEMLSIVGQNGAGKSTLSKIIVGFENQDSGSLYLDGQEISDLNVTERAEEVGIVLQNPNQMISKHMIYDEVALGLQIRQIPEEEIRERVEKVLKVCGLAPFIDWPISALSYGQKKRVTIASILVLNPKIIILDEPTAGQDFYHYSEIMRFLKTLNENGQTIILITHDMHLMLEYTKRAVVLADANKMADTDAYKVLCDQQLVKQASLKETSLFTLATKAGIDDPVNFVKCFINYDKKEVNEDEN